MNFDIVGQLIFWGLALAGFSILTLAYFTNLFKRPMEKQLRNLASSLHFDFKESRQGFYLEGKWQGCQCGCEIIYFEKFAEFKLFIKGYFPVGFKVERKDFLNLIQEKMGLLHPVRTGDPPFDDQYAITEIRYTGVKPGQVKVFFQNPQIHDAIQNLFERENVKVLYFNADCVEAILPFEKAFRWHPFTLSPLILTEKKLETLFAALSRFSEKHARNT